MATKTTTQPDQAATELTEAVDHLDELRNRIADGDTKVTAAQLGAAESAVKLAEMRVKAAEDHARKAADAERKAAVDALLAEVESIQDGPGGQQAATLFEDVTVAVDRLFAHWHDQESDADRIEKELRGYAKADAVPEKLAKSLNQISATRHRGQPLRPANPAELVLAALRHLVSKWDVRVKPEASSVLTRSANVGNRDRGPLGTTLENASVTDTTRDVLTGKGRTDG